MLALSNVVPDWSLKQQTNAMFIVHGVLVLYRSLLRRLDSLPAPRSAGIEQGREAVPDRIINLNEAPMGNQGRGNVISTQGKHCC